MTLRQRFCLLKARVKLKRLEAYLESGTKLLDVGTGNGALAYLLGQDHAVTGLDIQAKSQFTLDDYQLYQGESFPFENQSFHTVLMITMLHHTPSPERILQEAKRVGSTLIVMEDVHRNSIQKYITMWMDSLVNWEFKGHPHTNKSDDEWRRCFDQMGLSVTAACSERFLVFFRQTIYHLKQEQ